MSKNLRHLINFLPPQENVKCCASSATLLAAEMLMKSAGKDIIFSRLHLYYYARKLHNGIDQTGASLKDTLDALVVEGVCPNQYWPFSSQRANTEPSFIARKEAAAYKLQEYTKVKPAQFRSYLDREIPIVIGVHTGKRFWALTGPLSGHDYAPLNGDPSFRDHALTIVGYDDEMESYIVANSIGLKWGDKGYGALPYACEQDIGESYVIDRFAGIPSTKNF